MTYEITRRVAQGSKRTNDEGSNILQHFFFFNETEKKLLLMQLCSQCQECVTRFRLSSPAMSGEAEMNEAGDGGAAASSEKNMRESVARISALTR